MHALKLDIKKPLVSIEEKILLDKHPDNRKNVGPTCDFFFHELKDKSPRIRRFMDLIIAIPFSMVHVVTLPLFYVILYMSGCKKPLRKFKVTGVFGKEITITTYNTGTFQCLVLDRKKRSVAQRFFHGTGLYKLPLILKVLRGHMTLVGPEPIDSECAIIFSNYYTHFYKRYVTRPGIFAPSTYYLTPGYTPEKQISSIERDLAYVRKQNIFSILKVLLKLN